MRVSLLTLLKLALLSHGVPSVSAATPWLEPDLRVSAISLTDVDTFRCLMENADLDKVRSLHIRVGARPGRPSYIAPIDEAFARGMRSISVKEYYETKLPQLAAAASELIERMPRLASFRWVGEDVPLVVVNTLQSTCPELRNVSWMIRKFDASPGPKDWPREPLLPEVEPGVRLAATRELASFADLTSFSLERRNLGVDDWVDALLVLAERSPRLQHLTLLRDRDEWRRTEPVSVEALSHRYRDAGGKPLSSLRGLHLREGFHFFPSTTQTIGGGGQAADNAEQQSHPAAYLEQLVDMSALTAISLCLHRGEKNTTAEDPHEYFRPVAWTLLGPRWLPRLESLWLSLVNRDAHRYLRHGVDVPWLANIDVAVGAIYGTWLANLDIAADHGTQPQGGYPADYAVDAFAVGRTPPLLGLTTSPRPRRRVRSLVIPELRGVDMATVARYGDVQHLATTLRASPPSDAELRAGLLPLRGLETIQLLDDQYFFPPPKRDGERMLALAEALAAACPRLWYIRINVVYLERWCGGMVWNVRRRPDGSPVLERLVTREQVQDRPAIYDQVVDQWEDRWGQADRHITCPSREKKKLDEAELPTVRPGGWDQGAQRPLGG